MGWQEGHNVKRPSGFFNVDIRPGEMSHRRLASSNARDTKPFAATTAWNDYYDWTDWPCDGLEALARESRMPPGLGSCQ